MKKLVFCAAVLLLCACTVSGPQQTLNKAATALEDNNPQAFMAQIDMKTYASNYLRNMTLGDSALSSLNALGNALGLGNLDNFLENILDMENKLTQNFETGVSSGELIAQCRVAIQPDCPWVPQSLRDAVIMEVGENAAIAKITTPARITSWLALRKIDNKWLIVAHANLEKQAREFALAGQKEAEPSTQQPKNAPAATPPVKL